MTFAHPPRTPIKRAIYRAPIWIYRIGLGSLLGSRFVLLTHIGRNSGQARQVVLEVVGRHEWGGVLVASGYGARSQWFKNITRNPRVRFQVGRRSYEGTAAPLPPAESGRVLAAYARQHPRTAASLLKAVGHDTEGSDAGYERVGADRERGIPIVWLRPASAGSPD
ncbi:deazaflavin-dependent oxidoreductase (nitroreductase family) [Lipingzhangella halophila]|uniref:Deazaflavin-dependent oxidoreductase (Nitroreductase family) n=1 Tax=Lipingzhangella halophila TaxID=1783352 RepID=A0A7W7REG9_9ACTN|nr:nitroreductase family deazaflavin-dependent oxidoreductase [Lipingzhangella halophila]MBB4930414.1 deazaflavin-dependent oxidoreductase (nitroreductase family) [Lipingzhangella halophila]